VAPEHRQPNASEFLRGMPDSGEYLLRSRAPCSPPVMLNTPTVEISDVIRETGASANGRFAPNRDEYHFQWNHREPGKFSGWHSEDGEICKFQCAAHGARLNAMTQAVDESRTGKGFNVMEYDGDARTRGFQLAEHTRKFQREASSGPGEGGVLDQHPCVAPCL